MYCSSTPKSSRIVTYVGFVCRIGTVHMVFLIEKSQGSLSRKPHLPANSTEHIIAIVEDNNSDKWSTVIESTKSVYPEHWQIICISLVSGLCCAFVPTYLFNWPHPNWSQSNLSPVASSLDQTEHPIKCKCEWSLALPLRSTHVLHLNCRFCRSCVHSC